MVLMSAASPKNVRIAGLLPPRNWNAKPSNRPNGVAPVSGPLSEQLTGPCKLSGQRVAVFYDRTVPDYIMKQRVEPKLRARGDAIEYRTTYASAQDVRGGNSDLTVNVAQVLSSADRYSGFSHFFIISDDPAAMHCAASLTRAFPKVEVALLGTRTPLGNGVWLKNHADL
ncbi:hypothetical protein HY988_01695 [Candidatus Micrarchaeota archaeon]|nr:hypothetical protein [Candidatus Micrarchaeota archaeon]